MSLTLHPLVFKSILKKALKEDLLLGDPTSDYCVPSNHQSKAYIFAKSETTVSCVEIIPHLMDLLDPGIKTNTLIANGISIEKGTRIVEFFGNTRNILKVERTLLNFLIRMFGVSHTTRKLVELLKPYKTKLLDTRKTTPGLKTLEKHASRIGGAVNHRYCLGDAILIKENHIKAAGSLKKAIENAKSLASPMLKIEVEVQSLDEVKEALHLKVDMIMLDNMKPHHVEQAVLWVKHQIPLEVSGNITAENIVSYAKTGVDYVSSGSIFHHVRGADLSLLLG